MKSQLRAALFSLTVSVAAAATVYFLLKDRPAETPSAIFDVPAESSPWTQAMVTRIETIEKANVVLQKELTTAKERIVVMETVFKEAGDRIFATTKRITKLEKTIELTDEIINDMGTILTTTQEDLEELQSDPEEEEELTLEDFIRIELNPIADLAGPHIIFEGVNVHIQSGAGGTNDLATGLGNLIVGYNEPHEDHLSRIGSHNLVVGPGHGYSSYGGFVSGLANDVMAPGASITGGTDNQATGSNSTVTGGRLNRATGENASVTGGTNNEAFGLASTVIGGQENTAEGEHASVAGGSLNEARGEFANVTGGQENTASGRYANVTGGSGNTANVEHAGVIGGRDKTVDRRYLTTFGYQ